MKRLSRHIGRVTGQHRTGHGCCGPRSLVKPGSGSSHAEGCSSLPLSVLWKPVTKATIQEEVITPHLLGEACVRALGIVLLGRTLVPSPPFICSKVCLHQYGLMYLWYPLGYNPMLCYLLLCSNCSNFGDWGLSRWHLCPFDSPPPSPPLPILGFFSTSSLLGTPE